ncbi:MAG TPA: hypothetical protein VMK31_03085 [Sphingomicrobium sp.]|nr:hypothetical protein [Sphingomicrobium sp.]
MTAPVSLARMAKRAADSRISPRTNLFLGASLQGESFSAPVKIRNMSASGALVEGGAVPEEGAAVRLVRGGLCVPARVAWSADRRCGLRFAALVCVNDWLAPPGNGEQQRVDEVVRLVKAGAVPIEPAQSAELEPVQPADELRRVCALLEKIADSLSSDEATLAACGSELQSLDICTQTVGAVADLLAADCEGACDRLAGLRLSCAEALGAVAPSP